MHIVHAMSPLEQAEWRALIGARWGAEMQELLTFFDGAHAMPTTPHALRAAVVSIGDADPATFLHEHRRVFWPEAICAVISCAAPPAEQQFDTDGTTGGGGWLRSFLQCPSPGGVIYTRL